jgi:hypothetical protein
MMQKRSAVTRVVSAMLLGLTACHDLPTPVSPHIPAPGAARSEAGGLHLGQSSLVCALGRPTPTTTSWEIRRDTVFLPRSEYDARGRMVRYTLFQTAPGGGLAYTADCMVPYTEAALRRVDRHFRVSKGGGADQFAARQDMVTVQGCVTDGHCELEGLVVIAPPPPIQPNRAETSCEADPAACGTDNGEGGWEGGTEEDAYSEGPGVFAACVVGMLGTMALTAAMHPVAADLYEKAGAVSSAERMLHVVRANGASLETIARHEEALANARQAYKDAVLNMALAAGATAGAVIASVAVCAPALILPTP